MANKISTLVFVDSKVADYETLVNNVKPGTKVIILDGDRDGIEQITEILTNCRNLDSIQIVSHGDVASLQLGNSSLNSSNLDSYQPQLQQWKKALTKKGDILLLGCKVAEDGLGKSFINRLSELTKADVAASDDLTGNKDLGGNWKLEASTGLINAPLAFQIQALSAFNSVLQTFTVTNTNDSGVGSLRQAIIDAENNNNSNLAKDIIDLSAISGNRLILNSALPTITEQVEIQGNNVEVNGLLPNIPLQYSQLFSIDAETSTTQINLFNLKLTNGRAVGGNGSTGAGGGLGAGGALFINKGQVVVDNIAFTTNLAIGGNSSSGINGGGLGSYGSPGGNGGLFNKSSLFSGGFGGSGGTRSGDSGNRGGDGSAGDFGVGGGAGGGGGGATDGSFGSDPSDDGGNGGNGGIGGFGAGGGGGGAGGKDYDYYSGNEHGNGGNGAGGGAFGGAGSNGEYGGGSRSTGLGGGGAGLGGAIFVNSDANLVLLNSSFSNNSTIGGTGYQNGSALGNDIFVRGSASAVNTYIGDAYGTVNSFSLPTISILANSLDLSEPSSNNSFYLDVYPSFPIDLTVNYVLSGTAINGTDYNSVSNSVVIPAGNTSAFIDLSVIDDAVFETTESITVTLQDANNYNLEPFLSSATYYITDDEPTITLTGTANATEGGNKGEFTFNLSPAAPNNRNVKFKISGGSATLGTDYRLLKADGSVLTADSNGNYTLDISNRSSVVVRVDATGVTGSIPDYDDNIDENNETVEITFNSSTEYSGSGTASLNIIDNDEPPTISLVAVTNPTETGTTGIIDVDLSSKVLLGGAIVHYSVSGTGVNPNDYSLLLDIDGVQSNLNSAGGSFTLPEGKNSNSNIQIKVVPNDDSIFDPGETVTVTLGGGSEYVLGNSSATLTIQDNEVIPSAIISSDLAIAQEGDVLNFKINLSSPALFGGVVVNYSIVGTATNGTDFKSLSGKATIAEGKQELVVPVSSLEDLITEGAETIVISLNSGTGYTVQNQTLTLTITDDDTPGIIINPLSGSTTEAGGEAVFEAVLTSEPTSEVTLDLQSNDLSEGLINLNALIFNETNWDEAQSFTVTGVDDNLEDGDINYSIATTTSSNDKNYNAIAVADVSLVNIDDDGFGVLITASGGTTKITEGGTSDSYSLALSQTPVGKVEITVTADEQTEISSDGVTFSDSLIVTFSDTTARTITVKAKDDVAVEGTHFSTVTHQVSGEVIDSRYGADLEIADVTVEIADNDSPTVTILSTQDASEESLVVGQFNLALSDPAPTGGVTVNYSVNVADSTAANNDYEALSGKVLIKAGETGATINLVPVQDLITEIPPETVVINLAAGSGYKLGTTTTGTVKINDDDLAGVRITESGNQTDLVEGQKSDTYSLELTSQPNSDVTINFTTDSTQINSINSVTFTPENWQTKQTITVISVDDNQVLGDRTSTISHTAVSSDSNYNGIAIADVNASITENDTPGIVIANTNNLQLTEGEAGVSYTVVLTTQPLNDVTLNFGTSADLEAITPITFTTANWNIPQTVTVAAVVDTEVEPIEIQTITHSLVSNDAIYNGLEVPGVKVAINELTFDNTETASSLEDSLAAIQDSIDQQFSDIELPFIGSLTTLAPDLIGSFKDSLINAIQTAGELNSEDISALLEEKIEDALDIDATVSTDLSLEEATFDITLGKTYDLASLALDGDLGLPGLGINVDGSADLTFDYQFDLGFGINQDFGFFIDTEKTSFNAATNLGLSDDFQATGNLGFLKLDLTDDADNPTAATLEFDLGLNDLDADPDNDLDGDRLTISELRNGSLNDLFDPSASADVNLGLSAVTSIEGDTAFPSFNFDLAGDFPVLNYKDSEVTGLQKPTIAFNDVSLDLGKFLTDFTAPVISGINDVIEPFRPIIDFLNKDTQLISQISLDELFDKNGDGKVSVLELALKIAELGGKTPKANYIEFFDAVVEISDLVEELNTLVEGGDTITIDLGSYELGSAFNASDPNAEATEAVAETTKAAPSLNQQLDSAPNTGTRPTQKNIIKNLTVSGNTFEIPLLTNPLTAIDLLLGKDVPLFTYDLPALEVGFEVEKEFPIWGPISGLLEGDFNVAIDLAFGFDTYGLRQWQETTDFAPLEAYRVLDGFYVSDRENADGTGEDIAELVASATVAAGLGLDVVIASGYVKGGLEGIIGIDLIDGGEINGSDDGRIRASEISDRIMTPWELFQLSGVVNAFLGAEVKVGPPGFRETVWEKRFATFQLAEFSLGPKGTSASSVFDGVIVGGKVFFDANFNAEHDPTEPFTFTNADGSYSLEIPLYIYDLNTNGAINPEEGRVIIVDGIDSSTSLPQTAPIFTTPDATIATPLTSLTTEVAEPDFTASQAQVIAVFKLPNNSNLYEYEAANADLQLFATQAQLQNLIILTTQAIAGTAFTGETINSHAILTQEGLIYLDNNDNGQFDEDDLEISLTETGTRYFDLDGDKQLDSGELNSPVNEADIATAIINAIAAKIDNGETPDLSDTATIEAIIAEAVAVIETKDANIAFNTTELATLSQSIIEKNFIIDTILGNSFLTETEQKQQIVNQWVFIDTNNNGTLDSNEPYSFVNGEGTDELDITPYDTNNNGELDVRVIVTENAPEWVFFDSNGNGTHESSEPFSIVHASGDSDLEVNYLDSNNNGVQDNYEPFSISHSFGTTEVAIAPFDSNNNGVLEPDERTNLILKGTVLNQWSFVDSNGDGEFDRDETFSVIYNDGSDELNSLIEATKVYVDSAESPELAAGFQHLVINPLGTISRLLAESKGTAAAQQEVKKALGIPDVDLLNYDPLQAIADGEENGLEIYAKQVRVQNTIVQIEALGSSDTKIIDGLVEQIENNKTIDLNNPTQVEDLIKELIPDLEPEVNTGAANVITEANKLINEIISEPESNDIEKATEIAKVQQVAQGDITKDLKDLASGKKSVAEVVSENTGRELTQQVENAEAEDPTERPDLTNNLPVAEADTATTDAGKPVTIDVLANDTHPDNDTLAIKDFSPPNNGTVAINADNTITYTPKNGFTGEDAFFYLVEDSNQDVANAMVLVKVNSSPNNPPVAVDDAVTTVVNQAIAISLAELLANDTDVNEDTLSITAVNNPINGTVELDKDKITFIPNSGYKGKASFDYTVSDGKGGEDIGTVNVTVNSLLNNPPFLNQLLGDRTVLEDKSFSFGISANTFKDIDPQDKLTYSATLANGQPLPKWLIFNPRTRFFGGKTTNADVGVVDVKVTAKDKSGASASDSFQITVQNVNDSPYFNQAIGDRIAIEDRAFQLIVPANTFKDVDPQDKLTYSATLANGNSLPKWLSFDSTNLTLSGTPKDANVGVLNLKITARDLAGKSAQTQFKLTVFNLVQGTPGADNLKGLDRRDFLNGEASNDTLRGGKGDDVLEGGAGDDLMFGEAGKDRFSFAGQEAFSSNNLGVDRIADFQLGDRIALSKTVFTALSTSVNSQLLASDFVVINTDSNSEISQAAYQNAVIVYNSATGSIFYNENRTDDGLGEGSKFASIDGAVSLSNNSFSVIQ